MFTRIAATPVSTSQALAEPLEARRLLAASIGILQEEHALYATGTEDADTISVQRVGMDDVFVRVNDVSGTFDMDDFRTIILEGLGGNDVMQMSGTYPVITRFLGGSGNDTMTGSDGNDSISGHDGDDSINGGAGNDEIDGGDGRDTISGGSGNDVLDGSFGADVVRGDGGDDTVSGGDEGDQSNDALFGGDGRDSIAGGAGADFMDGGNGDDWLVGGRGNDTLLGGADDDFLDGDGGNADSLSGGSGRNALLHGELGSAEPTVPGAFIGQGNRLVVIGTSGLDFINLQRVGLDDVRATVNGVAFTFDTDDFTDIYLIGHANNDFIYVAGAIPVTVEGGGGNDQITGGDSTDELHGDTGNDSIFGGRGGDFMVGDYGRDRLDGGIDNDTLLSFGDSVVDTLVGGSGDFDIAHADAIDQHGDDIEEVVIQQ
jgi:Ca2+-binding RTX toxin-like protein